MNLKKRTAPSEPESPAAPPASPEKKRGSVMVYILILFCAAFLLIAYSILMQQHSQGETLGKLQNSVTALQEVQALQDKIIGLQDQLSEKDEELNARAEELEAQADEITQLQKDAAAQEAAAAEKDKQTAALLGLYTLQQQYLAQNYDACRETIQTMEDQGLVDYLPPQAMGPATAPATRYQQLTEVLANL